MKNVKWYKHLGFFETLDRVGVDMENTMERWDYWDNTQMRVALAKSERKGSTYG